MKKAESFVITFASGKISYILKHTIISWNRKNFVTKIIIHLKSINAVISSDTETNFFFTF